MPFGLSNATATFHRLMSEHSPEWQKTRLSSYAYVIIALLTLADPIECLEKT